MRVQLLTLGLMLSTSAFAQEGFNYPGSDYRDFLLANNWQTCNHACSMDGPNKRKAWTYVLPGVQRESGHCWLKNRIPHKVQDANCVSGDGPHIID
jgi:hypothetical protein